MSKVVKARQWAFVAYPESVAEDWLDQLKLSGLKCAISPLHDKDTHTDPAVEDNKKPHWHVIVCWDGPTTYAVALGLTQRIKATIPVKLESVRGYYRYFTHADDPDKYQYDAAEIQHVGGFSIADYVELTRGERQQLMQEVQNFIRDKDIVEYAELLDILLDNEMFDRWDVAANNTLMFRAYITSRRHLAGGRQAEVDE